MKRARKNAGVPAGESRSGLPTMHLHDIHLFKILIGSIRVKFPKRKKNRKQGYHAVGGLHTAKKPHTREQYKCEKKMRVL